MCVCVSRVAREWWVVEGWRYPPAVVFAARVRDGDVGFWDDPAGEVDDGWGLGAGRRWSWLLFALCVVLRIGFSFARLFPLLKVLGQAHSSPIV